MASAYELDNGHANRRKEVIGLLFKAANADNVSAIKKLEEMGRIAGAAEAVKGREPRAPKPGKKEEQQAAAQRIGEKPGGKYSPPPAPKLVVNNNK